MRQPLTIMDTGLLIDKQNPDGGWPYVRGKSWTEPTVYAVMALLASGDEEPAARGLHWIAKAQRSDGGWAPQAAVDESSWVTALAALIPPDRLGAAAHDRAIRWLVGTVGEEAAFLYRVRQWLLGSSVSVDPKFAGWPWLPGSAAWVGPTSFAILALEQEVRRTSAAGIHERIAAGRRYLLQHMCAGGGWNHGGVRPLGYETVPYPETTGMALAALRGTDVPQVDLSLDLAAKFLSESRSADALNWLRLGLLAHGRLPAGFSPPDDVVYRTVSESSINLLVTAVEDGSTLLWA